MKSRLTFSVFLFVTSCCVVQAQADAFWKNMHGIILPEIIFYDGEGYSIFTQKMPFGFHEEGINALKKDLKIPPEISALQDKHFTQKHYTFLQQIALTPEVNQTTFNYFFSHKQDSILVLSFTTTCTRDIDFEVAFTKAVLENKIPAEVYEKREIEKINFAGKPLTLISFCQWAGVSNVQCDRFGQMNWSEFRDEKRAKQMIENQRNITEHKKESKKVKETEVPIIFDGIETKAIRLIMEIAGASIGSSSDEYLIIYYVNVKIRGRYVACILSHWSYSPSYLTLPYLLEQVMTLKT